jgi:predicted N-formylglutamate amidohydrolase
VRFRYASVVSCEHGGNRVPRAYAYLFRSPAAKAALDGHRGSDIGALSIARLLARRLDVPLYAGTVTRLLVDLNRSPHHRALFSEFSRPLATAERRGLLETLYFPHRERVTAAVRHGISQRGAAVHIAVHTFTPSIDGKERNADLGLLYDPRRDGEKRLCADWTRTLRSLSPETSVRLNYPYRGTADGLTTSLRKIFADDEYVGIELEINQSLACAAGRKTRCLVALLQASLNSVLGGF